VLNGTDSAERFRQNAMNAKYVQSHQNGRDLMKISRWSKVDNRWYLAVRCVKCASPIFFALDHGDGVEDRNSPPPEKLVLTCSLASCVLRSDYTSAAIMRLQKEPAMGTAPSETVSAG